MFLEEDFDSAVVIPRQCGHNAFFADFAPVVLVEKISDAGENSHSPMNHDGAVRNRVATIVPTARLSAQLFQEIRAASPANANRARRV